MKTKLMGLIVLSTSVLSLNQVVKADDDLPSAPLPSQQITQLSLRAEQFKSESLDQIEQAVAAEKSLTSTGDCGNEKLLKQCIQDQIDVDQARLNLAQDGSEEATRLTNEISTLESELSAPQSLKQSSAILDQASSAIGEMVATGDFSAKEHFGLVGKSIAEAFPLLLSEEPIVVLTAGLTGYEAAKQDLDDDSNHIYAHFSANPLPTIVTSTGTQIGYGYLVIVPFAAAGLIKKDNQTMLTADELMVGTALNQAVVQSLKYIVPKERPNGSDNFAFPSGHSSQSFMMATVLAHRYGNRVGIPAMLVAGFVGFTRMALGQHNYGEVIAGTGVGVASGLAAIEATENNVAKDPSKWGVVRHDLETQSFTIKNFAKIHVVPMPGQNGFHLDISSAK